LMEAAALATRFWTTFPVCPAVCANTTSNAFFADILRPTFEMCRALISEPTARVSITYRLRDVEERLRNASNVESQEPRIHPNVSDTVRARPVLRCYPVLSRHYREENCYKNGPTIAQSPTNNLNFSRRTRSGRIGAPVGNNEGKGI
jgi:hypothetical protein